MTASGTDAIGVVGGGIAGFAVARALSLRGRSCTVFERSPAPSAAGLGINLPGNAVRALAALGLAQDMVDHGVRVRRREYRNGTGRLLFAVDEERFWGMAQPSVCLRRGALLELLHRGAVLADTRWGAAVTRVEIDGAGPCVRVGAEDRVRFDLVVGADGVHSRVRAAVARAAGHPGGVGRPSLMTETSWRFVGPQPRRGLLDGLVGDARHVPAHPRRRRPRVRIRVGDRPAQDPGGSARRSRGSPSQ